MRPARIKLVGSGYRYLGFHLGYRPALPTPRPWLLAGLLGLFSCLTGTNAMAEQPRLESAGPPRTYRLDEVSIQLTRQYGHGLPLQRVSLAGAGQATLERDGQRLPFHYPAKDLLALLNEAYRIRFFDLPASYTTRYSVFLKDDGTVGTSALRMQDTLSTSLCLTVAGYEKCIIFGNHGPRELEELANRIYSEAERSVTQNPPK